MRKICILELLSAKNVKSFGSIRQDEVSRLVKFLKSSSGETINLTERVFAFTSSITCRAAFGEVLRDLDRLIALFKKAAPMAGGFELADLFPSNKMLNLDKILDAIVEKHKLKQSGEFGGEDILDVLLRMQNNGELEFPITNDNIKAVVFSSSPELAKHALKLHDPSFADRPQSIVSEIMYYHSIDIAFSPYGKYWKQMREICKFEMLSPKNVRSFGSIRIDEASRLVESGQGSSGRVIGLTDKFFTYSSSITCRVVFEGLLRDRDTLIVFVKKPFHCPEGLNLLIFFPR
ncbi:hypothetical protein BUALT_Bualt10G0103600 [Buddleja alternifolia]|uniref:Cytochrome P450 n=1 Tax=Buddleja alternifolia TaxID=168488 RepID=A0AAV6WZB9_9LAMI|nr:hypothetical protein BUALT_Bualt10G0103600 [Buddleja alternifolia]